MNGARMPTLKQRILDVLATTPGLTDRQLTNLIHGQHAPQQPVNIAARDMVRTGTIVRRKRNDGLLGNYPANSNGASAGISKAASSLMELSLSPVADPATRAQEIAPPTKTGGLERPAEDPMCEDALKAALVKWLEADGWTCRVAWGRERGVDLFAQRGTSRWIIEVKGRGSLSAMRVNYFLMILGETLQRMDDPDTLYSIALPDLKQYRNLWARLPSLAKVRTGISALFVDEAGRVEMDLPRVERETATLPTSPPVLPRSSDRVTEIREQLGPSLRSRKKPVVQHSPSAVDAVWKRIESLQGQVFRTKTGMPFTYVVSGRTLRVDRTDYTLSISDFAKAIDRVPFDGPGAISKEVRGPSYIWSILHDPRVFDRGC